MHNKILFMKIIFFLHKITKNEFKRIFDGKKFLSLKLNRTAVLVLLQLLLVVLELLMLLLVLLLPLLLLGLLLPLLVVFELLMLLLVLLLPLLVCRLKTKTFRRSSFFGFCSTLK